MTPSSAAWWPPSPPSPRQPVVMLLDDLHWADPASRGLLRAVTRQFADLPLLLLNANEYRHPMLYEVDEHCRAHIGALAITVHAGDSRLSW